MSATIPETTTSARNKILVYFLAAPEDQDECKAIKKYLSPVIRNSQMPIEIANDFEIPAGEDKEKYKQKLYEADIVLAFISADYINDDETYLRTQKVIERYNNNKTIMLPILVRNCLWKSTPFVNLPLLPKNFQPLNNKQFWNSEDDALTAVVNDISEAIAAFSNKETAHSASIKGISGQQEEHHFAPQAPETAASNTQQQPSVNFDNSSFLKKAANPVINNIPMEVNWRRDYYKDAIWKRGAAFMLDNFLTLMPCMIVAFILASVSLSIADTSLQEENGVATNDEAVFAILFTLGAYFVLCAAMESSKWRGTFGKRIMRLQITDREGQPVSFSRALIRNIVRAITGYSYFLIFPLIIQYFTFKKSRKLFHDQLSYTVIGERLPH